MLFGNLFLQKETSLKMQISKYYVQKIVLLNKIIRMVSEQYDWVHLGFASYKNQYIFIL